MRTLFLAVGVVAVCVSLAPAQLERVPDAAPIAVFGGQAQRVPAIFHNPSTHSVEAEVTLRLLQAGSSTTVPVATKSWKTLRLLPGETVLESAAVDFPAVRAESRFLVRWVAGNERVLGTTDLDVHPTNLLTGLTALAGEAGVGVFDPTQRVKPLLRQAGVVFVDLERTDLEDFDGLLALFGPFAAGEPVADRLMDRLAGRCKQGLAAVWIQPPVGRRPPFEPSFYRVPLGRGAVVVAQDSLVRDLAERPDAQSNLVRLAQWPVHPQPLTLPGLETENDL